MDKSAAGGKHFSPNYQLRLAREQRQLSQEEVAEGIGCDVRSLRRWEQEGVLPQPKLRRSLCKFFHMTPEALGFSREPGKTTAGEDTSGQQRYLPLGPLIGREQEANTICSLVTSPHVRLLTITGTGGIGKTHLAHYIAHTLSSHFAGHIYFVSLDALRDPALVFPTIARAVGLEEIPPSALMSSLYAFFQQRQALLVLDNFEHVLKVAPLLADLLGVCPQLKTVVTSREALNLRGEYTFPLAPLTTPDPVQVSDVDSILHYTAVKLFIERVRAVQPTFHLTHAHARTIAAICAHLDGLPLAIELAAARIQLFSLDTLLARLTRDHLGDLTGGARDAPLRHHTLRDTILWSYRLLNEKEQRLFRHFSLFAGGATLETLAAIYANSDERVVDDVLSLVNKHLLQHIDDSGNTPRFTMLSTIREYARECLQAAGEMEAGRQAHAEYFLALAERADVKLTSAEQVSWLEVLEREHNNLRAALNWFMETNRLETALRLCGALFHFWLYHDHLQEGYQWLDNALKRSEQTDAVVAPGVRAKACYSAAILLYFQQGYYPEQLPILNGYLEEALKLYRLLDDKHGIAMTLNAIGYRDMLVGNYEAVRTYYEESLPLVIAWGDPWRLAETWSLVACDAWARGDHEHVRALFEKGIVLARQSGDRRALGLGLDFFGRALRSAGDYEAALPLYRESLVVAIELGGKPFIISCLTVLGEVAALKGQYVWAAILWGAAEAQREANNKPLLFRETASYEHLLTTARTQLDEEVFAAAWARGRTLLPAQALMAEHDVISPSSSEAN